jgi:hypothetical protein
VLELPSGLSADERSRALRSVAHHVRPRLQLDRLPPGLEHYWAGR